VVGEPMEQCLAIRWCRET